MRIKIHQIDMLRDNNRVCFMSLDNLPRFQGTDRIDTTIYNVVYDGEVPCEGLEDVFREFNLNHPEGYRGRSLSVSDIVEVVEADGIPAGFYFCDSIGWKKVGWQE